VKLDHAFLDSRRQITDPPADDLVHECFQNGKNKLLYHALSLDLKKLDDIEDDSLKSFFFSKRQLPAWYDSQKIEKGQSFFYRQALPIMTLLGALSLPYCYAASPGNKA
jgi:hypothetical protein